MKKLMMAMLVLSVVSVASAGLSLTMAPIVDQGITWTVEGMNLIGTGTAAGSYEGSIGVIDGPGAVDWANATKSAKAGNLAATDNDGFGGLYANAAGLDDDNVATVNDMPAIGQVWFTVALIGVAEGDVVTVETWNAANGYAAATGSAVINVVPEPMTMALLGLGGLFLRRRK